MTLFSGEVPSKKKCPSGTCLHWRIMLEVHVCHRPHRRKLSDVAASFRSVPWPGCHSHVSRLLSTLVLKSRFAFSSCVTSSFLCLVPVATAGVAVHSDSSGQHRAVCPVPGVLVRRGFVVERSSASLSKQDMDSVRPDVLDNHRLQIVAATIDTTVVSVLERDAPHPRCADVDEASQVAEGDHLSYGGRPVRQGEVGRVGVRGGWQGPDECLSFLRQLARVRVRSEPQKVRARRARLCRVDSVVLQCGSRFRSVLAAAQGWHGCGWRARPRCMCKRMLETQALNERMLPTRGKEKKREQKRSPKGGAWGGRGRPGRPNFRVLISLACRKFCSFFSLGVCSWTCGGARPRPN